MKIRQLRELATNLISAYRESIRRACKVISLHWSNWHYKPHRREDRPLRQRTGEIAATRVRYGMWRIYMLRWEGFKDNHKRVHRIYREKGLNLRSKRPRRNKAAATGWNALRTTVYTSVGRWILCRTNCLMGANSAV